jgi:aerobic-type carbon monoxide dehydrogenase small subunit (CoxS/CutS family)
MTDLVPTTLTINGEERRLPVAPGETLLEVLRETLFLTGTKRGCNQGVCGACTVLRDGVPTRACLALAADCEGEAITTIEGLAAAGDLGAVQEAFIAAGAPQCGFCMSGMVLVAHALLRTQPHPSRAEIREALSGNLCRCSGYVQIIEAIERAAAGQTP